MEVPLLNLEENKVIAFLMDLDKPMVLPIVLGLTLVAAKESVLAGLILTLMISTASGLISQMSHPEPISFM